MGTLTPLQTIFPHAFSRILFSQPLWHKILPLLFVNLSSKRDQSRKMTLSAMLISGSKQSGENFLAKRYDSE